MLNQKFKKSSCCIMGGCLEVRLVGDKVEIKDCTSKVLQCSLESWRYFIQGIKDGEFDI